MNTAFLFSPNPEKLFQLSDGCELAYNQNVSPFDLERYFDKLKLEDNLSLLSKNQIGNNIYRKYFVKNGGILNVAYTAGDCSLRVLSDPLSGKLCDLPPQEADSNKIVCQPSFTVLSLDYSAQNPIDSNGMSVVLQLQDGSYIIWDGGYPNDAVPLYQYLYDRSPLPDHQIIIAAWIFTHSHVDHYLAFTRFTREHAKNVAVKRMIQNTPRMDDELIRHVQQEHFLNTDFYRYAEKYRDVQLIRVHSGDKLVFPGAELDILQTFEDILPNPLRYLNEGSIVTRVTMAGQTILVMADAELQADERIKLFEKELKCDILQVPHHSYSGGSPEFFRYAAPSYLFWTTSHETYGFRTLSSWRNGLYTNLIAGEHIVRSFVADGPVKILKLPITDVSQVEYYHYKSMLEIEAEENARNRSEILIANEEK